MEEKKNKGLIDLYSTMNDREQDPEEGIRFTEGRQAVVRGFYGTGAEHITILIREEPS